MAKDKPVLPAGGKGVATPTAKPPKRFISTDFTLRSRYYPAGAPLDHLAEHDLRELIVAGHAVPVTTEPAPDATTTEEQSHA